MGKNSVGKTNLLEGIFFVCNGKGLREEKQEELMNIEVASMHVEAEFSDKSSVTTFKIVLKQTENLEKIFFVDRSKKMLQSYLKYTPPIAIFSPELIAIIDGQPSLRRGFIDDIISKCDLEYKKRLQNYKNGLRRRNKVIEKENDPEKLRKEILFWNNYLIEQAEYICEKREWFVNFVNKSEKLDTHVFSLNYEKNEISLNRFEEYFMREYYQKRTLIGPQRDDFKIFKQQDEKKIDVHKFSSRGEQRLALLWLIINQIQLYEQELEHKPLVLLDDIFSELDESNKKIVLDLIKKHQTIISTTEEEFIKHLSKDTHIIRI